MCVTEFRRLCQASEFRHGEANRQRDLKDPHIEVKEGTQYHNGRSYYYATDKRKLKGLEKYTEARQPTDDDYLNGDADIITGE